MLWRSRKRRGFVLGVFLPFTVAFSWVCHEFVTPMDLDKSIGLAAYWLPALSGSEVSSMKLPLIGWRLLQVLVLVSVLWMGYG